MPILIEDTLIEDVKIIRATRFYDERGFFTETYKESEYTELGLPRFVQDNLSESSRGVIRGLHWQATPHGQGKLVTCLSGAIMDVAVDIRKESKTYGNHVAIELNSSEQVALWIPEGFAHGFQALQDDTRVFYKVTNYWNKESEFSLNAIDIDLKISWPLKNFIMSEKDIAAPKFAQL